VLWLLLLPNYLRGEAASAYIGILLFLFLPIGFFAGLALIPFGIIVRRRKVGVPEDWSPADVRRMLVFVGVVTFANIVIGSNLVYRAVTHMDSVQFCGQTCHTPMKPEFTAHNNSAHSNVECVKCHIGPGASGFVESKLNGVHQLVGVAFNS